MSIEHEPGHPFVMASYGASERYYWKQSKILMTDGYVVEIIIKASEMGDLTQHDILEKRLKELNEKQIPYRLLNNIKGDDELYVKNPVTTPTVAQ